MIVSVFLSKAKVCGRQKSVEDKSLLKTGHRSIMWHKITQDWSSVAQKKFENGKVNEVIVIVRCDLTSVCTYVTNKAWFVSRYVKFYAAFKSTPILLDKEIKIFRRTIYRLARCVIVIELIPSPLLYKPIQYYEPLFCSLTVNMEQDWSVLYCVTSL